MMKAYGSRLMIEPEEQKEEIDSSGFVKPEKASEDGRMFGRVINSGKDAPDIDGTRIMYESFGHTPYVYEGKTYHIIHEEHIIATDV